MGLIFSLLEDYGFEHHLDDFNIDKDQSFVILTWLVQVLWVVVMLATIWSFILGTLAPFKQKPGTGNRFFGGSSSKTVVIYDSVVYTANGSVEKESFQNGIRRFSNVRIRILIDKVNDIRPQAFCC